MISSLSFDIPPKVPEKRKAERQARISRDSLQEVVEERKEEYHCEECRQ